MVHFLVRLARLFNRAKRITFRRWFQLETIRHSIKPWVRKQHKAVSVVRYRIRNNNHLRIYRCPTTGILVYQTTFMATTHKAGRLRDSGCEQKAAKPATLIPQDTLLSA
jgi:hypothetical protein